MTTLKDELAAVQMELKAVLEHIDSIAKGVDGREAMFFRAEVRDIARYGRIMQNKVASATDWLKRESVKWKSLD